MQSQELFTTKEVADLLGWSYDYTRKLLREVEPAERVGKRLYLWSPQQIEGLKNKRSTIG